MAEENGGQKLLIFILIGLIVGILFGGFAPSAAQNVQVIGDIFMNLLKMIVVPLVVLSLVVGITGLGDVRNLGSIGGRTIVFYMATTGISVLIGIIAVNIIRPGVGISSGEDRGSANYSLSDEKNLTVTLDADQWEKIYSRPDEYELVLIDQNVKGQVASVTSNSATVKFWDYVDRGDVFYLETESGRQPAKSIGDQIYTADPVVKNSGTGVKIQLPVAGKVKGKEDKTIGQTMAEVILGDKKSGKEGMIPRNIFNAMVRMDILPLIFFSLLIGAALSMIGEHAKGTIDGIGILNEAVMKIVHWIVALAPIGIFGLVAARIGKAGGFSGFMPELVAVGKYFLTVVIGLTIHGVIVLPLILKFFGKRSPIQFASGMRVALLNAFSTASSSATLPLTMECVEENNEISDRTASFVLPLGATINMDGTALYESVAAIFIAQVYGIDLSATQQIVIFLTATLAAIGAAGIPEAGLVTMVIVLKAVDLPIEGITLILAVDWLLDRFRTTVNVWGDSVGTGVIETLENSD